MSNINNKTPNVKEAMSSPPRIIKKYKVVELGSPVFKLEINDKGIKNTTQNEYYNIQKGTPKIKKIKLMNEI
jgi:hypothetical protein